jgi:hypothetical protein
LLRGFSPPMPPLAAERYAAIIFAMSALMRCSGCCFSFRPLLLAAAARPRCR